MVHLEDRIAESGMIAQHYLGSEGCSELHFSSGESIPAYYYFLLFSLTWPNYVEFDPKCGVYSIFYCDDYVVMWCGLSYSPHIVILLVFLII